MPYKQRTQCRHPDCPVLIPVGSKYCDAHRRQHKETVRSAASRGYTSRWQRISRQYLRQHPLCVRCGWTIVNKVDRRREKNQKSSSN